MTKTLAGVSLLVLAVATGSTLAGLDFSAADLREAIHMYELGQYRRTESMFSERARSNPEDPDVHLWLGKASLKIQSWDEAVQSIEKAVQLRPESGLYHLWLGRACGGRAAHSSFLTAYGWARRVVKEFETARKLSPSDLDVRFDLLEFYLEAPGLVGGGRDKAEAEAKAIAAINPMKGYVARAEICQKDRAWGAALKELSECTSRFPNLADPYLDLAEFYLDRQSFSDSADAAAKALSRQPASIKGRMVFAASEIRLSKDVGQARKTLQGLAGGPLTDSDPSFEEVNYWLGEAYMAEGNREAARQALDSALGFNPEYEPAKKSRAALR